jgi:hypothetical protein
MPPPFSPLFVRLLFAISFFRAPPEIRRRAGFRVFGILSIDLNEASDLNDASQRKASFADRGAARVGLLSRCLTQYLANFAARSQSTETPSKRLV